MPDGSEIQKLIDDATAKRGYKSPWHDYMSKADPEYLAAMEGLIDRSLLTSKHLGLKTKEMIVLASVATQRDEYGLREHVRRAFRLGVSEAEVLEIIQTAALHTGALTLVHGINALLQVLDEDRQAG